MDGYDAVFLSPHKFLGGPGSPGVLLMSDELYRLKHSPPSTSGGGTVVYVNGYSERDTLYCEDVEEREDAGTPAIMQKIRAALAFRVKEHIGNDVIREREASLAAKALERLSANPNILILGDGTTKHRQSIVSFLVYPEGSKRGKHLHCRFVTILLNDLFGVQARGGCACAGPYSHALLGVGPAQAELIRSTIERGYESVKPGFTRVGFCYYASPEEIDFVLDAVDFVAANGHRFLSLYKFNWRTGDWHHTGIGCDVKEKSGRSLSSSGETDSSTGGGGGGDRCPQSCKSYFDVAATVLEKLPLHPPEAGVPGDVDG
jgi:selenocysteine lyase/cysteine desulfurase